MEITDLRQVNHYSSEDGVNIEELVGESSRELTMLYNFPLLAEQAKDLQSLSNILLDHITTTFHCHTGILLLVERESEITMPIKTRVVIQRGELIDKTDKKATWLTESPLFNKLIDCHHPILIPNISTADQLPESIRFLGTHRFLLAPIYVELKFQGAIGLMFPPELPLNQTTFTLITAVSEQIGRAINKLEHRQQDQEALLLAERERLGRELHDSVTQSLYGLVALAEAAQAQMQTGDIQKANHSLIRIAQTGRQTLKEMRLFIHQLRPHLLERQGLIGAIHLRLASVEGRADVQTRLEADSTLDLPKDVENAFYHITQEALNNTMRHANATNVTVSLHQDENRVVLEVSDDGQGFDLEKIPDGRLGLNNIRQYVDEIKGNLQIRSLLTQGTTITVTLLQG